MMGANWQSDPQHVYKKKFAWLPITTNSKKRVWLEDYYVRYTHYDANGKPPIHGRSWKYIYTKNELLIEMLKDETKVY